jgi:hypothetical protein
VVHIWFWDSYKWVNRYDCRICSVNPDDSWVNVRLLKCEFVEWTRRASLARKVEEDWLEEVCLTLKFFSQGKRACLDDRSRKGKYYAFPIHPCIRIIDFRSDQTIEMYMWWEGLNIK